MRLPVQQEIAIVARIMKGLGGGYFIESRHLESLGHSVIQILVFQYTTIYVLPVEVSLNF